MIASLKAYVPTLASRLGTTPAALYERQRALVRDGILEQSEGRGPGSGVSLGPHPVALLLVAVLATDSLAETADKVRIFAAAKSIERGGVCPLTRMPTFIEAMSLLLDPEHQHWEKITNVTVHRTVPASVIRFGNSRGSTDSEFVAQAKAEGAPPTPTKLLIDAMLTRDLIIAIATDLKKITGAQQRLPIMSAFLLDPGKVRTMRSIQPMRRIKEVKKP